MLKYCTLNSTHWVIFDHLRRYVLSWLLIALNFSAILGGTLCICVIIKYNVFSVNTKSWFLALIISDIVIILFAANDFYFTLIFENNYDKTLLQYSSFVGCQLRFGFIVAVSWICSSLQTGLSLERTFHIISPLKARIIFTVERSRIMIALIVVMSGISGLLINIFTLEALITHTNETSCERKSRMTKVVYFIDLIIFRGLTFGIITITTVILVVKIRQRRHCKRFILNRGSRISGKISDEIKVNSENRMFILLIVMNIITLATNPLFLLFELIDGEMTENMAFAKVTGDKCLSSIMSTSFNELMYVNNLTNWIFYINIGSKFRSHLKKFIFPSANKTPSKSTTNYETSMDYHGLNTLFQKPSNPCMEKPKPYMKPSGDHSTTLI